MNKRGKFNARCMACGVSMTRLNRNLNGAGYACSKKCRKVINGIRRKDDEWEEAAARVRDRLMRRLAGGRLSVEEEVKVLELVTERERVKAKIVGRRWRARGYEVAEADVEKGGGLAAYEGGDG